MADAPLRDSDFDLVSTVYHAAQGARTSRQYAEEARACGDAEAAAFLDAAHDQYEALAERGRYLLKQRL